MTQVRRKGGRRLLLAALSLLLIGAAAVTIGLEQVQVAPRQLGPYLERRSDGHNPLIEATGRWLKRRLVALDRAEFALDDAPLNLGAQAQAAGSDTADRVRLVAGITELRTVLANAVPGDVITLLPGRYLIDKTIDLGRSGSAQAPITVRARLPGTAILEQTSVEGFRVRAPYWRFENLTVHGVCRNHSTCEHAFHVVGSAHHFVAINNTVVDFNAHFKINGHNGVFPDHGLIEANTLTNTQARVTANPVTPIDLVGASGWTVRRNLISDFVKAGGNRISYGAFAKGGGARNVFEQNLVWCERHIVGLPGQRVGLSLGGGGTGKDYCRDRACVVEQQQSTLRSNLVASCSDVGVYLNDAAQSTVLHNSVIDTAGVDVRFAGSSADLQGNLIDGPVRSRNGGIVREYDNLSSASVYAYLGYHPVRKLYAEPGFTWSKGPIRREAAPGIPRDLCEEPRGSSPAYGAFENFASCLVPLAEGAR